MLLVTQIHLGANQIADGTLMLVDAVEQGGFSDPDAYTAIDLAAQVKRLRQAADDVEKVRARLIENSKPKLSPINQLVAAE
jgi:hypothetical protein